jgi:pimeloyl-ACP methyl ester carboxylesterase
VAAAEFEDFAQTVVSFERRLNMQAKKGKVYVIDGAGGSGFLPFVMQNILTDSRFDMEHFRWSVGYMRIIKDLTNRDVNRAKARDLSRLILEHRESRPDDQIHVVAKSAGTAIALWAMAELPERILDRVILLAPAVSPGFPLEGSLKAARRDVYSFWSPRDLFFLGLGTSLFGTADGVKGKSAGLVGFEPRKEHQSGGGGAKMVEIEWEPRMLSCWHVGDHAGTSMPRFIKRYVMPLLEKSDTIVS